MSEKNNDFKPVISVSPHIRDNNSVTKIMLWVIIALLPAFAMSFVYFGIRAIMLTAVSIFFSILTEWIIVKYLYKKERTTIGDLSAVVTGILLAFNLPAQLPLWMAAIGAVFAIGVAKMAFGGLGFNFINPALAGRAFLMAAYPVEMTHYTPTLSGSMSGLDAITTATPLQAIKTAMWSQNFDPIQFQDALKPLFTGNVSGCIGETSAIALLLGGVLLMYKRIISIRIPALYILTVFILFWLFGKSGSDLFSSEAMIVPLYHILAGGLFLGAFFMATDMVTSPITPLGQAIFAIGCGILTFTIRKYGGYPEGVSYSILLMNLTVPLLDRYTRPKIYGKVKKNG